MITILGAGVAGLCAATVLAERGLPVEPLDMRNATLRRGFDQARIAPPLSSSHASVTAV